MRNSPDNSPERIEYFNGVKKQKLILEKKTSVEEFLCIMDELEALLYTNGIEM